MLLRRVGVARDHVSFRAAEFPALGEKGRFGTQRSLCREREFVRLGQRAHGANRRASEFMKTRNASSQCGCRLQVRSLIRTECERARLDSAAPPRAASPTMRDRWDWPVRPSQWIRDLREECGATCRHCACVIVVGRHARSRRWRERLHQRSYDRREGGDARVACAGIGRA
jgi:hypothetical protein